MSAAPNPNPNPILTYFDSRGLAEVIRLIFCEVGQPYDDRRIGADEWAALKPTLPFQQLPLLQIDGVDMVQSTAIARYLGACRQCLCLFVVQCLCLNLMRMCAG